MKFPRDFVEISQITINLQSAILDGHFHSEQKAYIEHIKDVLKRPRRSSEHVLYLHFTSRVQVVLSLGFYYREQLFYYFKSNLQPYYNFHYKILIFTTQRTTNTIFWI